MGKSKERCGYVANNEEEYAAMDRKVDVCMYVCMYV